MKYPQRPNQKEQALLSWLDQTNLPEVFRDANCKGANPRLFDSNHPARVSAAKKLCAACPIQTVCRNWALATEQEGTWGGLTAPEREALTQKNQPINIDELMERRRQRERVLANLPLAELAKEFDVTEKTIYRWRLKLQKEAS